MKSSLFIWGLSAALLSSPAYAGSIQAETAMTHIQALQQTKNITGKVLDERGEPMIGVSVVVKGTKSGAITDFDGNFKIQTSTNAKTLVVSYMGYKQQEVTITTGNLIIKMQPEDQVLDEVVVVGYGAVRKRDLTGSVGTVGAEKLKERSFGNALQSMAGQVSGVQITQTQGAPGMAPTIKVRGATSINAGTTPLYVIDGVPLEDDTDSGNGTNGGSLQYSNHNPMNNINPNDIESIEVLKDAASAAIYGSRGANGVVLITTKQGKAGKTKVNLSYEIGMSKVNRKIDLMDAKQWIQYETAARQNEYATDLANNPNPELKPTKNIVPTEFSDPECWNVSETEQTGRMCSTAPELATMYKPRFQEVAKRLNSCYRLAI